MPQAQTGKKKSTPKVVRVNAADSEAILYRNLGNGRRVPFIWGDHVTLASGSTEVVLASGVEFHGKKVAEAGVGMVPTSSGGAVLSYYVEKDVVNNVVKLKTTGAPSEACGFDVLFMLGVGHSFNPTDTTQVFWRASSVTYTGD